MIIVSAIIEVEPAQRDAFIEAVRKIMAVVQQEEGCERFAITADLDDDTLFHLNERWTTQAHLDVHNTLQHTADCRAWVGPLVKPGTSGTYTVTSPTA